MDYTRDYFVHYYEVGPSRRLTLSALLGYFEDIAILHSEARGLGLDWYEENRCGWMLIKWDVSIRELPRFGQTVTLATRINGMKSFFADREFTLLSAGGEILAEGRSNWILVDMDKRRPMRIPREQWERFAVGPESASKCVTIGDVAGASGAATGEGRGAEGGASPVTERTFTASNGDIDTNLHVNNLCFIEWALDSLSEEYLFAHEPERIAVQYRKELGHGAEARVATVRDGKRTLHSVYAGEAECCSLEIGWREPGR